MAHTTHSTPSPPHSRQVHETSTTSSVHLSALKAAPSHIVDRPIHRQLIIKSNTPCRFPYRDSSLVPHSQHAGTCTRHNFGDVREQHPHESYTNSNNIPLRESLHRRAPLCTDGLQRFHHTTAAILSSCRANSSSTAHVCTHSQVCLRHRRKRVGSGWGL